MTTVTKTYTVSSTEDHEYLIVDANGVYTFGTISNLVDDETRQITANLTSYKTVTLSTGVSNLSSVQFKLGGKLINATDAGSGNYTIKIADGTVSSAIEIPYYINDDNYAPYYSSLTFSGSNVTESITLTSGTKSTFIRPNLTANGVLGGSSFAVSAPCLNNDLNNYGAWRAVDSDTSSFWHSPQFSYTEYVDYLIYNPNILQVGSLTITMRNNYSPTTVKVYTSLDGVNWDLVQTSTYNSNQSSIVVPVNSLCKYIKLNMNNSSNYLLFSNITFSNTYEWVVSDTFDITVNTTPADAVVLFNSPNVSGKTATIGYAGAVQYTVAKSGYKPVSGVVSTINTDKTVNVSLTEQETPNMTWYAWTNNGTTVYTQTETPVADLDWTFSAPNTIANVISAVDTNTITSNGVTYTKATASNVEGYLDTQYFTIQTDAYTANNTEFYLPVETNTPYAITVNWGDGNTELIQGRGTYPHHTYSTKGTYQINIKSDLYKMPRLIGTLYNNSTYKNPNYQIKSMDSYMLPMYQNYLEDFNGFNTDSYYYLTYYANNLIKPCSDFTNKANLEVYKYLFNGCSSLITTKGKDLSGLISVTKPYEYSNIYQNCTSLIGAIDLSSLTTASGDYSMYYAFQNCSNLTSVDLSSLTTVSGQNSMNGTFNSCTKLTSVDLSSLTTISGSGGMNYTFFNCSGLTTVDLSGLTTVSGNSGMSETFRSCTGLTTVDLSSLTTLSDYSMYCAFNSCTKLTSVDLSSLTTVSGNNSMYAAFESCTKLTSVDLSSLTTLSGSQDMRRGFYGCTSLRTLSFPSLTSTSFGSYTNQFNDMLQGCSNVTVHFPTSIKETIQDWTDVQAGFSGTNTTVLFDIGGCEVTFNCTPSTNNQIWIKDRSISGNVSWEVQETTLPYQVFNTANHQLYVGTANIPDSASTTVNVDTTTATSEIKLNTGVSGLDVTYTISGQTLSALDNSNGTYSIFINAPSDTTISYFVNGGNNYTDASGTLTYTGSSITENVLVSPATSATFTQPVLTANGTLGGDSFAVDISNTNTTYRSYAYQLFDGNTSTNPFGWSWYVDGAPWYWICYNPNSIKITSFIEYWTNTGSYYIPTYINIYGSNNGSNWTLIKSITRTDFSSATQTITVDSSNYYKYHKVEYKGNGYVQLKEITLTATVKTPAT